MMPRRLTAAAAIVIALVSALIIVSESEAKLLQVSRQRFFDEPYANTPYGAMATGERAVITVRGARNPYDGLAPARLSIADDPYRGPLPRGVYDRLDYPGGRMPYGGVGGYSMGGRYPMNDYYNGPYGGGAAYGVPSRIAVTGAYPYGYGSRYF